MTKAPAAKRFSPDFLDLPRNQDIETLAAPERPNDFRTLIKIPWVPKAPVCLNRPVPLHDEGHEGLCVAFCFLLDRR